MSRHNKVAEALMELASLDRAALVGRWASQFQSPAPKSASRVFLLRALSYELQCQHAPGLPKANKKVLRATLNNYGSGPETASAFPDEVPTPANSKPRISLVPGSRLVREWNGHPYTVSVIEEGFVYKDRTWSSLSAIAKDITGAHWSGPRFFGLNKASP